MLASTVISHYDHMSQVSLLILLIAIALLSRIYYHSLSTLPNVEV